MENPEIHSTPVKGNEGSTGSKKKTTKGQHKGTSPKDGGSSPVLRNSNKRKRYSPSHTMSTRQKKPSGNFDEPTNRDIMKAVSAINLRFDTLAMKDQVEKVENRFFTKNRELASKIQDNVREIANLQAHVREELPKLVAEATKGLGGAEGPAAYAAQMRRDAKSAKYLIARSSFRIGPVSGLRPDNEDDMIKKFFAERMGVA